VRREFAPITALGLLIALAGPVPASEVPERVGAEKVSFDPLFRRLTRLTHASVSVACGSSVAPWAYRGTRGHSTALRSSLTVEADEAWTRRFVRALMRPAVWDSALRCQGSSRSCEEDSLTPMVVVTVRGRPDVYVLLLFEDRCSVVFEADRALGSASMGDRADSLFEMVQQLLPESARWRGVPPTAVDSAAGDTSLALGQYADLDSLPESIHKVPPIYPTRAREDAAQGTVWVQARIGRDGTVKDAFVVHPMPYLDNAALDAVWQWTFRPAIRRGEPITVWVMIPVKFTLH